MLACCPDQIIPVYVFPEQGLDSLGSIGIDACPGTVEEKLGFRGSARRR